jgi:DNA-binding transcriptional LysR family regulator
MTNHPIWIMNEEEISLRHLRVLTLLLEVGSPTRVAQILETTQPTISKVLTKLRSHFGDPLFVRTGRSMRPTPKAIELAQPLRELLMTSAVMRSTATSFNPKASTREFSIIVTEVGMIHLMMPIIGQLEKEGPGLRLKAVPLDSRQIDARLEAAEADVALGVFPDVASAMRRQLLYSDAYVSVVRSGHPRLKELTKPNSFMREQHVVVTSSNRGRAAHRVLEQRLSSRLKPDCILVRVPDFLTSAFVARSTDAIGTIPAKLAEYLAEDFNLTLFPTPLPLPRIEVTQFWHERVQNDEGHRWFREALHTLFGAWKPRSRQQSGNSTSLGR